MQSFLGKIRQIFLCCAALTSAASCAGKQIATVSSEAEAIEITDILRENDIAAEKQEAADTNPPQFRVVINSNFFAAEDDYAAAIQILRDNCLPQREPPPVETGGLTTSLEAERAKIQRGQKINIINQLRRLPGVTCVDVNFTVAQENFADRETAPATASVLLNYKTEPPVFSEQDVKNLVSGSVPKLAPERVQVKLNFQPPRPIIKSNNGNIGRLISAAIAGLLIISTTFWLVYLLRKRRAKSFAPEKKID
jgi:type III secretory pathway lipoprotein EscJ